MKFTQEQQSALFDILKWRRDVRRFKTDPVPAEVWQRVKAAVDLAPSVGNSQPWRFIEVQNERIRNTVASHFDQANNSASQIYSPQTRDQYTQLKLAGLREAPIHLAVFTEHEPGAGLGLGRQTMPLTLDYSTVAAIHNLWLAARAHNLGMGWVSIVDPDFLSEMFEVSTTWSFTAYLCIGYAQSDETQPELEREAWQARQPTIWLTR